MFESSSDDSSLLHDEEIQSFKHYHFDKDFIAKYAFKEFQEENSEFDDS